MLRSSQFEGRGATAALAIAFAIAACSTGHVANPNGGAAGAGAPGAGAAGRGGGGAGSGGDAGGGGAGAGGTSGVAGAAGGPATLDVDGFPSDCPETPVEASGAKSTVGVRVALQVAGEPYRPGERNALADAGVVLPTNLRFYLSGFRFSRGSDHVDAVPVGDDGKPLRYGVQLVVGDDPRTTAFSLRVPAGHYDGVSFLLGLTKGCNDSFSPRRAPLDEASQLKWPHTLGFLYFRYEANEAASASGLPNAIHMGQGTGPRPFAPLIELRGDFDATGSDGRVEVSFALDEALRAAAMPADLSDFHLPEPAPPTIGPEVFAGERLRRHAADVTLFSRR